VLLLLTVGLLLIGLVTLVIGFLNSSLALDYISIAASALSFALVLLFTRLGRARSARTAAARGRQEPAPLASSDTGDTGVIELDTADSLASEAAAYPRASRAPRATSRAPEPPMSPAFDEPPLEEEDEDDESVWEPEPAPPPAPPLSARAPRGRSPYERPSRGADIAPPVPAPVGRGDDDRHDDDRFADDRFEDDRYEDAADDGGRHLQEYDDLEFPIADYDELRVAEILPLLEELEPDEIEVVRDREQSGRNRAVVLRKLDELIGGAAAPSAGRRPATPVVNGTRHRPTAERPAEVGYDDEDAAYGDGYDGAEADYDEGGAGPQQVAFPIADYDDLRLTEILPLLPQLEPVELEMVRQRELEGERRATLLNRIDALIGTGPARTPAR